MSFHIQLAAALEHGDLQGALRLASESLTEQGADDPGLSCLLSILKTQLGDFSGAVGILESLASTHPDWRSLVLELSLCVEAEQQRAERRRHPEVAMNRAGLGPPPEFARELLEAMVCHAAGDHELAVAAIARAEDLRPAVPGTATIIDADGESHSIEFANITVADALTGPMLEGIGPFGLLDIPFCEIASISLRAPSTYHDTLWIVASVDDIEGRSLDMRLPTLAPGSGLHEDASVRMGRLTLWDHSHGYRLAQGQVDLELLDTEGNVHLIGIQRVRELRFEPLKH